MLDSYRCPADEVKASLSLSLSLSSKNNPLIAGSPPKRLRPSLRVGGRLRRRIPGKLAIGRDAFVRIDSIDPSRSGKLLSPLTRTNVKLSKARTVRVTWGGTVETVYFHVFPGLRSLPLVLHPGCGVRFALVDLLRRKNRQFDSPVACETGSILLPRGGVLLKDC